MQIITRGRGRVSLLAAALAALALASGAPAAAKPPAFPLLVRGSHGDRVRGLQWMLAGNRPSAYVGRATFAYKPNGYFGPRTATAVVAMKRRLGFPDSALHPVVGADFWGILRGDHPRPLGYIVRATARLAEQQAFLDAQASSACAQRLIGLERSQLGIHEIPDGSNRGPRISYASGGYGPYQASTGAYGLAWCASFQAWAYRLAHIGYPNAWNGFLADSEASAAGVFAIERSAQGRGWVQAIPKPGYLVAFMDGEGHIGLVEHVFFGAIETLEGNTSNQVGERWHPFGSRPMVFIRVPGCAAG